MRILRAADAALTAFIQELWPAAASYLDEEAPWADHGPLCEPPLNSSEIVAVRELIEERFGIPSSSTAAPQPGTAVEDGPADGRHDPRQSSAGHPFDFTT